MADQPDFLSLPGIRALQDKEPLLWLNPVLRNAADALGACSAQRDIMDDAAARLRRWAPYLAELFHDLRDTDGIIESDLVSAGELKPVLERRAEALFPGKLYIKTDHALPVAGSIKARGGLYEVLCIADRIARENEMMRDGEDCRVLQRLEHRRVFGEYTIAVGSTGNLGLSVGITAAALGFNPVVHMSADAKEWKKKRLRRRGVTVVEHDGDYAAAVAAGRDEAERNPKTFFIDDENSLDLFAGYSTAGPRLREQLKAKGITINGNRPLFVYLPCGVGGAPGGITFGLKHEFGDAVHTFFAEPVEAPCFQIGMICGFEHNVSVYDIGLHNDTDADGLAVGTASALAGGLVKELVSGCYTVPDDILYEDLYLLDDTCGMAIEPSAAAGIEGPGMLYGTETGREYLARYCPAAEHPVHVIWTTGGLFVPREQYGEFYNKGKSIHAAKEQNR